MTIPVRQLGFAALLTCTLGFGEAARAQSHRETVQCLAFSPDGERLASGGHDGLLKIWDLPGGRLVATHRDHRVMVSDIAFSGDGKRMVSVGWGGIAIVRDRNGAPLRSYEGHDDVLYAVAIHPNREWVATAGNDMSVQVWSLSTGQPRRKIELKDPVASALAFRPDGETLAVGTRRNTVRIWGIKQEAWRAEFATGYGVEQLEFRDRDVVLARGARALRAWSVPRREVIRDYEASRPGAFGLASAGDVIAADGGDAHLWPGAGEGERKRLAKGDYSAAAITRDGAIVALGTKAGAIELRSSRTGEVLHAFQPEPWGEQIPDEVPVPAGLAATNLMQLARAEQFWTLDSETGAFKWQGDGDQRELRMRAAAVPDHVIGHDWLYGAAGFGTQPFDLTWEVDPAKIRGHGTFKMGWFVGVSSAPPGRWSDEDLTALIAMQSNGIAAGAQRARPYEPAFNYTNLRQRWEHSFSRSRINYSEDVKGTISTDYRIRFRIRRDGENRLHFAAWCPYAGQSVAAPWWSGTWDMPAKWAGTPLNYLIIQRIPSEAVHLGAQGAGYADVLEMRGAISDMRMSLATPSVQEVTWGDAVLAPGSEVSVRGTNFPDPVSVRIGETQAKKVKRVNDEELSVTLPDVEGAGAYRLCIEGDGDGERAYASTPIPVGRLLERSTLVDSLPAGGDVITIHGAGFEDNTRIFFGETEAEVVGRKGAAEIQVRVPEHEAGSVQISARTGAMRFSNTLPFGYTPRPSLWFDAPVVEALRAAAQDGPKAAYAKAIVEAADRSLKQKPHADARRAHQTVRTLAWAYLLTGDNRYADRVIEWAMTIADKAEFGGWSGWNVSAAALAYDMVAARMTPAQRSKLQQYFMGAVDDYIEHELWNDWFISNNSSTNPLCNNAGIVAAAVLQNVRGDTAEVMTAAKGHLDNYIRTAFGPDGGCTEGLYRSAEGLTDFLKAAHLLARHLGDSDLLEHPRLRVVPKMFETLAVTVDRALQFADTHDGLKGVAVCAYLGTRQQHDLLMHLADRLAAGNARGGETGFGMLWRTGEAGAMKPPKVPRRSVQEDVQQAVLRTSPELGAHVVLGVKGGLGPLPYHYQKDLGSFCVFVHGEQILHDRGWGKRQAKDHSLPIVDEHAPGASGAFIADAGSRGKWQRLVVESTQAYPAGSVRRVRRTILLHDEGTVVVLDDILPAEDADGNIVSRFQVDSPEIDANSATAYVQGKKAAARLSFHGPGRTLSRDFVKGHHGKRGQNRTVNVTYRAAMSKPLITVIDTAETMEEVRAAALPKVAFDGDSIKLAVQQRRNVTFVNGGNGWTLKGAGTAAEMPPALGPAPVGSCVQAVAPPTVDGRLDDAVWAKAPPLSGFVDFEGWGLTPARIQTEARFAYDQKRLYAAFRCYEPNLEGVASPRVGPAQNLARDARVLFLLDPDNEGVAAVSYGVQLPASGDNLSTYGRSGDLGSTEMMIAAGREDRGADSAWILEVSWRWEAILNDPWHRLKQTEPPTPGTRMGLNIQRTRVQDPYELSVWSLARPYAPSNPGRWGELVFE